MRRIISGVLACVLLLSGCGSGQPRQPEVDQEELTILTGPHGGLSLFYQAIREKFPDIPLNVEYYAGPNTSAYIDLKLRSADAPDLVCLCNMLPEEAQQKYLLDLSPYPFVNQYHVSFLNKRSIDGRVYLLPSPYTIAPIYYNKSLFDDRGWQVPANQEELLALVRQIRAESDITPVSFSGLFDGTYFKMMASYSQCSFLSSPEGKQWEEDFARGQAGAEEGFREGISLLEGLAEAGAFDASDADSKDGQVFHKLLSREAAIAIPQSNHDYLISIMPEYGDEVGTMPYYGLHEGDAMLTSSVRTYFGLSRGLGERGNEKKLEQALKIMEYLSSEEGQSAMMSGAADISPLTAARPPESFAPYEDIWEYVEAGRFVEYLYGGYEDVVVQAGSAIKDAFFRGGDMELAFSAMDKARRASLEHSADSYLAQIREDMTTRQTAQIMADMLLEEGGGDVALVSAGGWKNGLYNQAGVNGRMFAGPVFPHEYNVCIPGGLNVQIVNVSMTGRELLELLEEGRVLTGEGEDGQEIQAAFDYWCSGMTVAFRNGAVSQAELAGGAPVEERAVYRVSMAANDFDADRFQTVAESGTLVTDGYLNYLSGHPVLDVPQLCRD